jgi:hypothetical protein
MKKYLLYKLEHLSFDILNLMIQRCTEEEGILIRRFV